MPVTGHITISASAEETLTTPNNRSGGVTDTVTETYQFLNGTAAGQNDLAWSGRVVVPAATTWVLDLLPLSVNGVAQTDAFGTDINFVKVTAIIIRNREAANTLRWGPTAAQPFLWLFADASDRLDVVADSVYGQWNDAGAAPGAGASDQMDLENLAVGSTTTVDILIIGRTV
jgi:hypothetical protein